MNLRRLARLLKALGHRDRLRIVAALARRPACVCELTAALGLRQATVSQHLSMLRRVGAVRGQRAGTRVVYRIVHPAVVPLLELLGVAVASARPGDQQVRPDSTCRNAAPSLTASSGVRG